MMRTRAAPERVATSRATTVGTSPDTEKNSIRTDSVFWARKSTRAMPSTMPTKK